MKIPDNSLQSLTEFFRQDLSTVFDERELQANLFEFFYQTFGLTRSDLILSKDRNFSESEVLKVFAAIKKLKKGIPLAYVLQRKEFYGLPLVINESVLIPRPETEELVDWILRDHERDASISILDIGTGSACIALALKRNLPASTVLAVDVSPAALELGRKNSENLNLEIEFQLVDFLQEDPKGMYDIIVSNPPYIPLNEKSSMEKNVVEHEPHLALFVQEEPLIFYLRMMDYALKHLKSTGLMYWEVHQNYAGELKKRLLSKGFENVELKKDINNNFRMIKCSPPL